MHFVGKFLCPGLAVAEGELFVLTFIGRRWYHRVRWFGYLSSESVNIARIRYAVAKEKDFTEFIFFAQVLLDVPSVNITIQTAM